MIKLKFIKNYILNESVKVHKFTFLLTFFISINAAYSIRFIDVDQFEFSDDIKKKGLRICVFDVDQQKFDSITYYNFYATQNRQPDADDTLLENFYGAKISYSGTIKKISDTKDCFWRTCGKIQDVGNTVNVIVDEEQRNIAYFNVNLGNLNDRLTQFTGGGYKKNQFLVTLHDAIKKQDKIKQVTFQKICENGNQNNKELGAIGELATRMTMFAYGYTTKIKSQNGSNQGLDGIFLKEYPQTSQLWFTESKCRKESKTAKNVMQSDLGTENIYNRINQNLSLEEKKIILHFLKKKPEYVFQAVHRILKNGQSQWLVQKFDHVKFWTHNLNIGCEEKYKKYFIESIEKNFNNPSEMIRVLFSFYEIKDQKEKMKHIMQACNWTAPNLQYFAEQFGQEQIQIEKKLDYEQDITEASIEEKQEIVVYNRQNLSIFLAYLKELFPRQAVTKINEKITEKLSSTQLSQLSNFEKYSTHFKTKDFEPLWKELCEGFSDHFKQAIKNEIFENQ